MTMCDHTFWLYLLALGLGTVGSILATQYHASLELRDGFIVLDMDITSISVQRPGAAADPRTSLAMNISAFARRTPHGDHAC